MGNIYENLEPNEMTSMFPMLSENQLSSIGGGGSNLGDFTISRWRHLTPNNISPTYKSGSTYQFSFSLNTFCSSDDETLFTNNTGAYVKVKPNTKFGILLSIIDNSLTSIFKSFTLNYSEMTCGVKSESITFTSEKMYYFGNTEELTNIKLCGIQANGSEYASLLTTIRTNNDANYTISNLGFIVIFVTANP